MDDKKRDVKEKYIDTDLPRKCKIMLLCLQKKGFSRDHCLRALAHTGYSSLRRAIFWLCLHVDDPLLMVDVPQDFLVLLCIEGEYGNKISEFREGALNILGWDSSLDYPPCIDILRFEAPPAAVPHIHNFFRTNATGIKGQLSKSRLDLNALVTKDSSSLGLNLSNPEAKHTLQEFRKSLAADIKKSGLNVTLLTEPQTTYSVADLTLAHAFVSEQFVALCQLYDTCVANTTKTRWTSDWSIRLYSRDPRLRVPEPQVYEMLTTVEAELVSFHEDNACLVTETDHLNAYAAPSTELDRDASALLSSESQSSDNNQPAFSNPTGASENQGSSTTEINLLSHTQGDHVLLIGSCCPPGRQGCPFGVNLATGKTGMFNLQTGHRVPQYDTWVLHCSIPIRGQTFCDSAKEETGNSTSGMSNRSADQTVTNGCSNVIGGDGCDVEHSYRSRRHTSGNAASPNTESTHTKTSGRHPSSSTTASSTSSCSFLHASSTVSVLPANTSPTKVSHEPSSDSPELSPSSDILHATHNSLLLWSHVRSPSSLSDGVSGDDSWSGRIADPAVSFNMRSNQKSRIAGYFGGGRPGKYRRLFVMRHAERVDVCFGRGWVTRFFDKKGVYRRSNLNLPAWLPPRADYLDYVLDSPITQVGLFVSAETGRSLAEAGVRFTVCYSSPSLRCVQTACELLRAMGHPDLLVRIEPHLFEWFGWYGTCAPRMMSPRDLRACGYQVDVNYRPLTSNADFDPAETISDYYNRTGGLTRRLLGMHKAKDTCILIVAHASSLDTCTHQLVHHGFRTCISSEEFHHRTSGVPYCGLVVAQENRRWTLINPPIPSVCSYSHNPDFDWRQLLSPTLCGFAIK